MYKVVRWTIDHVMKCEMSINNNIYMSLMLLPLHRNLQNSSLDIRCNKGFYKAANGTCQPECGVWTPYSEGEVIATDTLAISAAVIAVVSSITVLILSYVYRQKM